MSLANETNSAYSELKKNYLNSIAAIYKQSQHHNLYYHH